MHDIHLNKVETNKQTKCMAVDFMFFDMYFYLIWDVSVMISCMRKIYIYMDLIYTVYMYCSILSVFFF